MTGFLRFIRGLAALALLTGLVSGTPVLLLWIGRLPGLRAFPGILLAPDNGLVLVWLLTLIGWLAWAGFTWSVILELVALLGGRRLRFRVPGLSGPRGPAAVLLISIAAMLPLSAHAHPIAGPPPTKEPVPVTAAAPRSAPAPEPVPLPASTEVDTLTEWEADGFRYVVQRGDDLWSLAERFYGDGLAWSRIAAANPIITSPDSLDVGCELLLPGVPDPMADEPPAERPVEAVVEHRTPPPQPVPEPAAAATPPQKPASATAAKVAAREVAPVDRIAYATAGVSSLVAAALLVALTTRRAVQLSGRAEGRRIVHPGMKGLGLEAALGQAQDPVSLRALDLALRALGRHQRDAGQPLPALLSVLVADDDIVFEVDRLPDRVPAGFQSEGSSLRLGQSGQDLLAARAGSLMSEPSPYPALVCLGETPRGALQLHDVETTGSLVIEGPVDVTRGVLNSLVLELSCSWWGRGQSVIVVNGDAALAEALDDPTVRVSEDLDAVLAGLTAELPHRHPVRTNAHPRDLRIRPELEEAWRPKVLLVGRPMTTEQRAQVEELVRSHQLIVVAADPELSGPRLAASSELSRFVGGLPFRVQAMTQASREHLLELLRATASTETTIAPWWSDADPDPGDEPDGNDSPPRHAFPPEAVPARAHPDDSSARGPESGRATIVSLAARRAASTTEEPAMDAEKPVPFPQSTEQPVVLLVGPVELVGARGERPARAARQCMEYAAWLLEHPGATASTMATALFVAESTRRSNMSRLRSWLGSTDDGERFLPEAYSGRIQLHAAVTSDWNRMQLLTIGGVNRVGENNLRAVLQLVRGAALADAAPGQWHWAEELRTDICSLVRDVGLVLCDRALDRGDLDLARWAVNRALIAAPEDERLLVARVRTEHRAGNQSEVERLALRLVRTARKLNVDLSDETVTLLQEAMEGAQRQRLG